MSNRELPMMPWFPDQFAASTAGWTFKERAVYRSLLDLQWMAGDRACIPSLRSQICRALEIDGRTLANVWKVVGPKFAPVAGGLQNYRLEQHRLASLELRRKKSEAGRSGADSRWHSHSTANSSVIAQSIAELCPPSLKNKNKTLLPYPSSRKRDANGKGAASRPSSVGSGEIREDDPEVQRKRREAETLAAQHAKGRDDDGMPF